MTTPITIPTDLLEAVARWALDEGIDRPVHLSQIVFRDDEMIATDGKRAVIAPVSTHGHAFGLRRADAIAAIAAQDALSQHVGAPRGKRTIAVEPVSEGRLRVRLDESGARSLITHAAGESLPVADLRQILDDPSLTAAPGVMGFNPAYLAAIDDVLRALGAQPGVVITRWGGPLDPMVFSSDVIESAGLRRARFAVMPMRM